MKLKHLTFHLEQEFFDALKEKIVKYIESDKTTSLSGYETSISPIYSKEELDCDINQYFRGFLFNFVVKCTKNEYDSVIEPLLDSYRHDDRNVHKFVIKNLLFYIGDGDDGCALSYDEDTGFAKLWIRCFEEHSLYYTRKSIKNKNIKMYNANIANTIEVVEKELLGCRYNGNYRGLDNADKIKILDARYNKNEFYGELDVEIVTNIYCTRSHPIVECVKHLTKQLNDSEYIKNKRIKFYVYTKNCRESKFTLIFIPYKCLKTLQTKHNVKFKGTEKLPESLIKKLSKNLKTVKKLNS